MALAFHCPHCGQPLPVSAGMLGQKVTCAGCETSFFLAPTHLQAPAAVAAPPKAKAATATATTTAAPPVAVPMAQPVVAVAEPPRIVANPAVPSARPIPPAAAAAPVARTTAPPPTTSPPPTVLKAAADGKLPTLALHADASSKTKNAASGTPSTLMVFAALAISATMSVAMLLIDFDSQPATTGEGERARQEIQRFYGDNATQLLPYQKLLRESQRAHTRQDLSTERRYYRQVLELLRAEGRTARKTLTGTSGDDAELERILTVLLRDVRETSLF